MTKQDAIDRLNQMRALFEQGAAKLQAIIDAPEVASLLKIPKVGDKYYQLAAGARGGYWVVSSGIISNEGYGANCFESEELAQNYADAFTTMMLLRRQPGTVSPSLDDYRYRIEFLGNDDLCVDYYDTMYHQASSISPLFDSQENARNAINVVGETRIRRMFETFHHMKA